MKLGSLTESFPAVSLIAESKIDGIFIELETIDLKLRKPCQNPSSSHQLPTLQKKTSEEETISKSILGSYIEAALATLRLNLKLTKIHIKFCHHTESNGHNVWVELKIATLSYNDLDDNASDDVKSPIQKTVVNKAIEFSEIILETGEDSTHSVVALAEGNGHIFLRIIDNEHPQPEQNCKNEENGCLERDVEVRLNHQLNFSFDNHSLLIVQQVLFGFNNITEENTESDEVSIFRQSSMMKNPHMESTDLDREDLKALTGIMRQYREAYHMAEQNKIKGGILVPSNAYLDEGVCAEDIDDEGTFDMFFDANDQSLYNTTSILMESTRILRDNQKYDHQLDQIHTKLRINLLSFCCKINFRHPDQKPPFSHAEEYILATLNDLSLSLSSTQRTNEIDLSVTHIQVEDAYLNMSNKDTEHYAPLNGGAVKIGSILGWSEGDGYEEDNALVSEAPCLSIQLKSTRNNKKEQNLDCNMTLLPLELAIRQRTVANLSKFATSANDSFTEFVHFASSSQYYTSNESDENGREVSLSFNCPSVSFYLPLVEQTPISSLFERCGEISTGGITRESSIGVVLENTGFEFKSQQRKNVAQTQANLSVKFWCLHMGLFAISPKGEAGYETHMLRKDIVVASGRTEVNPSTPISFSLVKAPSISREENPGRESFPIVPAISSFKARQEDDDENEHFTTSSSRKDLRGTDPQIVMLANSEKSNIILTTNIPEILIDLTSNELETSLFMLSRIKKVPSQKLEKVPARPPSQVTVSDKISIAVNLDKVTISIRDDQETYGSNEGKTQNKIYSFLFAMDKIKSHTFLWGSEMKHFRLFSQDLCLYSSHGTPSSVQSNDSEKFVKGRFKVLKNTLQAFTEVSVVPILFRSQLFTPISQETPSIQLDFVDLSAPSVTKKNDLRQRRIYVTIYHLTYRYDAESDWMKRLSVMLPTLKEEAQENPKTNLKSQKIVQENVEASMTRLFVSFADVNIDYRSPSYFETVSKSIIRIGDFRLSSNMMTPAGLKQSYNLSIGDVTYHITSDMIESQHRNENNGLCRSSWIMKYEKHFEGRKTSLFGTMPEAILRELNFVNILSLDTMDVVVTQRIEDVVARYNCSEDPTIAISLTVGTLSMHACKDSFTCFADSVGELQSKVIGLTDDDIQILKKKSSDSVIESQWTETKQQICDDLNHNENQYLTQDIKILTQTEDVSRIILLDGHEWTTVDKDLFPGLVIPPGDEQISGWYNTNSSSLEESLPPSQVRHQHFPFHSISDPLSEGDMGGRTLVGETADLVLKSRLSIQKLNVKIRLFDGYDWPDKCSTIQKKAVKRLGKTFVIEPLPESDRQGKKKEDAQEDRPSISTKARLMDELLNPEDNDLEAFFEEVPLPEDKASIINQEKYQRLSRRRSNVFCQVSLNGIALRMDSYQQSRSHRLQSILEVAVSNLFVAERVSDSKPIKMIGEWSNDYEHPRDSRFGTLMLSMATWAPLNKITKDNEIASEECNVTVQFMPMRCLLDQRAISFLKVFFSNEDIHSAQTKNEKDKWSSRLHLPPPPTVKTFKIKPWKVKVDYYPTRIDVTALREGSIVELVNLSPIQRMIITLDEVVVLNSDGFGPVFSETVSSWIKDICATQLHKFLANARPFEAFTDVGQGLTDLVILPYEAFKQGDSIQRAMKQGVKSLAETVVFQTLATSSGLTKMAAGLMADSLGLKGLNDASDPLPSRPLSIPKGIGDARLHAARSLARGVSAANYKVVVVPYREYLRSGVSGAVTSVIKGIPVLLVAPLSGVTEAASYTLLGARNALRPDLRKEEEASIL
jgi:autophagy-related protein 2